MNNTMAMENEIKEVVSPKGLKPKNQRKRAPKPMKEEGKKKKKGGPDQNMEEEPA